jgi:hypothetical protein
MAYGTYDRMVVDSANDDHGMASAILLGSSTGAILTKTLKEPRVAVRFGYWVTTAFNYNTPTAIGVLTLYKYPGGNASNKVALATINLVDGALASIEYFCDVDDKAVAAIAPYEGLAFKFIADLEPMDQIVVEMTTRATGGSYLTGAFQPFICLWKRAEETQNQQYTVDLTPVKTPVQEPY